MLWLVVLVPAVVDGHAVTETVMLTVSVKVLTDEVQVDVIQWPKPVALARMAAQLLF